MDFIYGGVDCARHTVWGSTTELGWEEEAGGRKEAKRLWKGQRLAKHGAGQMGRAPVHIQAGVDSGSLAGLTPCTPSKTILALIRLKKKKPVVESP